MLSKENILHTLRANKSGIEDLGIKDIGLFGSYSRDEQQENSDIDLLIDFYPDQETFDNLMRATDFFEVLFSGHKLEIVTRNGLSPYIGPHILNEIHYA